VSEFFGTGSEFESTHTEGVTQMSKTEAVGHYEAPRVVDYGDLQELTASCLGGSGGDAGYPGQVGGYNVGPSVPGICQSKP
jgi:hypothetical protein